jgi:DNA-binding HxlR family transcriptional regulator
MGNHSERSGCPIAYCLDVLGDRWSLLILRDVSMKDRQRFQDFLDAPEGISSNILADRLRRLERWGLLLKVPDPDDGRRHRFFLTDDGLELLPILIEMALWGAKRHPGPSITRERAEEISMDREGAIRAHREKHVAEREAALQRQRTSRS